MTDSNMLGEVDIPSFDVFSKEPIFRNLDNIHGFQLAVEVPKSYNWRDPSLRARVGSRVYDEALRILDSARFYSFDRLRSVVSDRNIGVVFDDDDYGFEIYFNSEGNIIVARNGSSFERFHNWYVKLMPSMESLVNRLLEAATEELLGDWAKKLQEIRPIRVQYRFEFVAYDLKRPPSEKPERNLSLMTKLLGSVPLLDGHLSSDINSLEEFGRVDVKMNRWSRTESGVAREVYEIEAPGNRRYSAVWFTFAYIGETYQAPDGTRQPFDASEFLKHHEQPYVGFLRKKAIEAFLRDLTESFVFETTAGLLP